MTFYSANQIRSTPSRNSFRSDKWFNDVQTRRAFFLSGNPPTCTSITAIESTMVVNRIYDGCARWRIPRIPTRPSWWKGRGSKLDSNLNSAAWPMTNQFYCFICSEIKLYTVWILILFEFFLGLFKVPKLRQAKQKFQSSSPSLKTRVTIARGPQKAPRCNLFLEASISDNYPNCWSSCSYATIIIT